MSSSNLGQPSEAVQDNLPSGANGTREAGTDHQYIGGGEQPISAPADAQRPAALEIMQRCQRWLLWREEPDRNGKPTKVPYYPNGSRRGKTDTQSDWQQLGSYQQCADILEGGGYTGLAFALGPDGNGGYWQGIDLDKIPQNHLSDLANNAPGYVELSPSRNGAHAIGYGRAFATFGSNGTGVEAYSAGRFFTFTGETIRDGGLVCLAGYVEQRAAPIHGTERSASKGQPARVYVEPRVVAELRSALFHLSSDNYQQWIHIGLALSCLGDTGRGLWMDWSATSDKFNPSEAAKKWQSFESTDLNYQTVFHTAQQHGWVNPNSNGARIQLAAPTGSINVVVEEPNIVNVEYLDNPFIPKGQAIGFYGRGESGKSSAAATFCSRNSDRFSTLWITSEESPSHIITRHKHSGGHDKTMGVVSESGFDIYTHLEGAIKDSKQKLVKPLGFVVLDAVVALVTWGKGESANDDGAVKRLIGFIDRMAQAEGVSILMVGHLNKGKGHEHIADAVLGATAWTSSVRLAYMLQKVPEEDYAGFIRTAKTNVNIHFGAFYRTVPVYQMAANIDGFKPSLCKIEFTSERIYGERNLIQAMADDDDVKAEKVNAKQKRIDHIVDRALHVLQDGAEKTRADIQTGLGMLEPSRRDWLAVDESLIRRNVQIRTGERNKNYYQLYPTTPSQ